jgi:Ca2+-binding RTX toxin-like protein
MDLLHGEGGIDTLLGGAGRDFLSGGSENDFLYAMSDIAASEPVPAGTWLQVYAGLLNREVAIVNEMSAIEAFITANPGDPSLPELQAELARLSDELVIINLAQNDVLPYQSVQVDILLGDAGDDWLQGSAYNDRLIGGSGNDTIVHTTGADIVFGGTDPLSGDTTDGTSETDEYRVRGTHNADVIAIRLDAGNGTSAPIVFVEINGAATQANHLGIEVAGVEALGGDDTISVQFGSNAAMKVNISGGDGNDMIDASSFQSDATISGGAGNDTILAGLGNDMLSGDAGNDILMGGDGLDTVSGGDGNDTISGGSGLDELDGGEGIDQLMENVAGTVYLNHVILYLYPFGMMIYDSLGVQMGNDFLWERVFRVENAHLTGNDGPDSINASTFLGNVTLLGRGGRDTLITGIGNDTIDGGAGDDTITGGLGNDTLLGGEGTFDQLIEAADVNMVLTNGQLTGPGSDSHSGFEFAHLTGGVGNNTLDARNATLQVTLQGGDGDDTLHGGSQGDTLMGGLGRDTLFGWGGDDIMGGEGGNDWMMGGDGNDFMFAHAGFDTLYGSSGDDLMVGGQDNDTIFGEGGNDSIAGDDIAFFGPPPTTGGADYIDGGSGDDSLYGSFGNDTIYGGLGNDTLHGDDGNDWLYGGDGRDLLYGGFGSDRLYGEAGNDFLDGGDDWTRDYLYGGAGADEFMNYYRITEVFVRWYWVTRTIYEEVIGDFNAAEGDWKTTVEVY